VNPSAVAMPIKVAAFLVAGSLHDLWWQSKDEDLRGCCPECCGPCSALRWLFHHDQLDDLYGAYVGIVGGEHEVWDAAARQVRRDWLIPAWSVRLSCHDEHGELP
jgi:hypothetical protein